MIRYCCYCCFSSKQQDLNNLTIEDIYKDTNSYTALSDVVDTKTKQTAVVHHKKHKTIK